MNNDLHFFLYSAIAITISIFASLHYVYIFKKINTEKHREAFYIILFFITNILLLITLNLHRFFNIESIIELKEFMIFITSSLSVLTAFSLQQAIFVRNKRNPSPLRKNKWLYLSILLVPIFCNCYLFYYRGDNLVARVMSSVILASFILLFAVSHILKNKNKINIADKFLIFIIVSITLVNILMPIILYHFQLLNFSLIIFLYLQIIQTSVWAMTFIIVFILDMVRIQYKTSITDSLTGLYNRKYFTTYITESTDTSSLFFIDIDFFKKINDTYGHVAGDVVLTAVAKLIKAKVGTKGIVARFGGEEFVVVYNAITPRETEIFTEELRKSIELLDLHFADNTIAVTVSIGVSTIQSGLEFNEGLKQADNALYKAKRNGRNQVCYC